MDPLTHGLVGSIAAQSVNREKDLKKPAMAAGFFAALVADVETFIHMPSDPLFNLEVHRQFSHAFLFIPVGALISAAVIWWVMKKYMSFRELYIFSFAGYATHGLMDVITSYGTALLWPLTETRFAWNLVSVVDPVLTVGLIVFAALTFFKPRKIYLIAGWVWLLFIIALGWVQQQRAGSVMQEITTDRNHAVEKSVVKPTIANRTVWRASYISDDRVYTDGIRVGLFSSPKIYEGESAPLIIPEVEFEEYRSTTLYDDLQRFSRFSNGYLVRHPKKPEIIGDGRFSMLPTSMIPLWGIEVDTAQTDRHVPFLYFRDAGDEVREPFMDMLLGRGK